MLAINWWGQIIKNEITIHWLDATQIRTVSRYALPTPNACGLVPVFHTTTHLLPPPTLLKKSSAAPRTDSLFNLQSREYCG